MMDDDDDGDDDHTGGGVNTAMKTKRSIAFVQLDI